MKRLILALLLTVSGTAAGAEALDVLVEEQAREKFGAELPEAAHFAITVSDPKPDEAVMFSAFWMDKATGQFVANAVTPDGEVRRIAGLAVPTVSVPVPVRRILPEEIIAEGDLQSIDLPLARLGAFAVTDPAALVGMQVRRVLALGRPVMAQSVMQPLVIGRGDRVSIRYDDGLMSLSAPGRALDDAHRGQEIRVVNLVSNTTVFGVASAEGIVEVNP